MVERPKLEVAWNQERGPLFLINDRIEELRGCFEGGMERLIADRVASEREQQLIPHERAEDMVEYAYLRDEEERFRQAGRRILYDALWYGIAHEKTAWSVHPQMHPMATFRDYEMPIKGQRVLIFSVSLSPYSEETHKKITGVNAWIPALPLAASLLLDAQRDEGTGKTDLGPTLLSACEGNPAVAEAMAEKMFLLGRKLLRKFG